MIYDVIVVGAGLSGLSAAYFLQKQGLNVIILEADNHVGGRVWSCQYNGFILDLGFQIFLDAYPEAIKIFDYNFLNLKSFVNGAIVKVDNKFVELLDPLRYPEKLASTLIAPIGTLNDKLKIAKMKLDFQNDSAKNIVKYSGISTYDYLKNQGFSDGFIETFLRPLFSGIFLETELKTDSGFFEFVFKMLASGSNCIPAMGMKQLPVNLASKLKSDTIILNSKISALETKTNTLLVNDGKAKYQAKSIILATTYDEASRLLKFETDDRIEYNSQICLYYSLDNIPSSQNYLYLNSNKNELINNLTILSNVSSYYAPKDKHLLSVCIIDSVSHNLLEISDTELENRVKIELDSWFTEFKSAKFLKMYRIKKAVPQINPNLNVKLPENIYLAGDYMTNPSINGALLSGKITAQNLIKNLKVKV